MSDIDILVTAPEFRALQLLETPEDEEPFWRIDLYVPNAGIPGNVQSTVFDSAVRQALALINDDREARER